MQLTRVGSSDVHYQIDGDPRLPWLVLSHGLGLDLTMWAPQIAALARRFRVLRYDTRGHGASTVPATPTNIEQLGRDVQRFSTISASSALTSAAFRWAD